MQEVMTRLGLDTERELQSKCSPEEMRRACQRLAEPFRGCRGQGPAQGVLRERDLVKERHRQSVQGPENSIKEFVLCFLNDRKHLMFIFVRKMPLRV